MSSHCRARRTGSAAFSPDGRWLLFAAQDKRPSSQYRVFVMHPDGSNRRQLGDSTKSNEDPRWTIETGSVSCSPRFQCSRDCQMKRRRNLSSEEPRRSNCSASHRMGWLPAPCSPRRPTELPATVDCRPMASGWCITNRSRV
ncbi:MAG: PD40 domain-containing protein [Acidobacteria bacterium]|nr:PD40 domain-containing protein [Acidobacteriota bacterium]